MATSFSSLPIIDLSVLSTPLLSEQRLESLSQQLHDAFATTGFAYLTHPPLTFSHGDVFHIASQFFSLDQVEKMSLAKKTFVNSNMNTYRGYFPPQPGHMDNLKEGFELGPPNVQYLSEGLRSRRLDLGESNVWPSESAFPEGKVGLEKLYEELQTLSVTLLSLLAVSLGKPHDFFSAYLVDPLSTLRLLHYPKQEELTDDAEVKLCCTAHTDR